MTALLSFALIAVLTTRSALALTNFRSNCTLPDTSYNYVAAVNMRTTLDIVWSSVATLIACTHTVLHLNVPGQRNGRDPGIRGDLKWAFKSRTESLTWTLVTILAPEYYALLATSNFLRARKYKRELQDQLKSQVPKDGGWTLIHAFYAQMGGFAIEQETHLGDRLVIHLSDRSLLKLMCLLQGDHEISLPTEEDIQDHSKSDFLAKTIVVIQVLYFVVNCLARLANNLALTQLEIGVLGTAACSLVSWYLLWRKPRSVHRATVIASFRWNLPQNVAEVIEAEKTKDVYTLEYTIKNSVSTLESSMASEVASIVAFAL